MFWTAASLLFWGFMLATSILLFPLAAILRITTQPFDRRLVLLHRFTCFWGSLYTWCNPFWSVQIQGRDRLQSNGAVILIANHQSFVDILVLFRLFAHFKWVSKVENFRAPLIGWNMSLNRYIPIARGTIKGNLQMMRACEEALRTGNSLMMFPEGTRSPDGKMRPFKDGAFELALRTQSPILPLVIHGTAHALPKRGILLRERCQMTLRVLPPIPYSSFSTMSARELNHLVWHTMEAAIGNQDQTPP